MYSCFSDNCAWGVGTSITSSVGDLASLPMAPSEARVRQCVEGIMCIRCLQIMIVGTTSDIHDTVVGASYLTGVW